MGCEKIEALHPAEELSARFRDEFPVTRNLVYLNHAAVAPICRRAREAMKHHTEDSCAWGSLHYDEWLECYSGLRSAAAKLIGASPEEIAIVKNTSEGIAIIAVGWDWKPGDKVVAFREEFPSNYYPWLRLEDRGVAVQWLSIYDPLERIAEAVKGARLLAVSFVNYLSGYQIDLEAIGRICHEQGCFFFVDAIQGLGAFPLDVERCYIDALAADGHKWLLGPEGNGILYVRKKWLETIEPVEFGWTNPANYADYSSRDMTLRPDAGRYECGTLNTIGCYGLRASLEFLLEVGVENVASAIAATTDQLESGLREKGYELIVDRNPDNSSGIVTFRHRSVDSRKIVSDLKQNRIIAAPRQGWVRTSPHFYIGPEAIEQVVRSLPPA